MPIAIAVTEELDDDFFRFALRSLFQGNLIHERVKVTNAITFSGLVIATLQFDGLLVASK